MVGEVLADRYELEELVGAGGMSSVFRAHDRVLERTRGAQGAAPALLGDEGEYVERFRREARTVAGLSHPNIVTVIDRGEDDGRQFIVFEYIDGENLKELIERDGPLPVERALELAIEIARGARVRPREGLVHRDVKPQNVLLNGDGRGEGDRLRDRALARRRAGVTQTGTVLGTSDYIAPEQAQGRQVDELTDVYSLGVVLYELLTGEAPFTGDNFVAVAMQHINEPAAVRCLERRPEVPAARRPRDRAGAREGAGRPVRVDGRVRARARGVPRRGAARRRRLGDGRHAGAARRSARARRGDPRPPQGPPPALARLARRGRPGRRRDRLRGVVRRERKLGRQGPARPAAPARRRSPWSARARTIRTATGRSIPSSRAGRRTTTRRPTGRPRTTAARSAASARRASGSCWTPGRRCRPP